MEASSAQRWDPATYARDARFVSDFGVDVVALLDPKPGERIVDLGCGDGALTERIAAAGADVVGYDAAASFVTATRARGLAAEVIDAQALTDVARFDAAFTNAALHWMPDHGAVLRGVRRALVPGGRFVGELGGHGNVAAIRVALASALAELGVDAGARSPWRFPTAAAFRAELEAAGFVVDDVTLWARPTPLPGDLGAWLDLFAQPFFVGLDAQQREKSRDRVIALLRPVLYDGERWTTDYVRLRFHAHAHESVTAI